MRTLFDSDPKYTWAGLIAIFALLGLTATTVIAMYHWPVEPDVIRQTNTTFGNVLTFVLGVFTGASVPGILRSRAEAIVAPPPPTSDVVYPANEELPR